MTITREQEQALGRQAARIIAGMNNAGMTSDARKVMVMTIAIGALVSNLPDAATAMRTVISNFQTALEALELGLLHFDS